MPQTESERTSLATRKQWLLAENESNRRQLSRELHALQGAASVLARRVHAGINWASGASLLVAGWVAFRHIGRAPLPSRSGARAGAWRPAHRSRSTKG